MALTKYRWVSIEEYMAIDNWITRIYSPGDTVRIESLNAGFLMDEIYERVRFK